MLSNEWHLSGLYSGGPLEARPVGPYGAWAVFNRQNVNVSVFSNHGATLSNEADARMFVERFSEKHAFSNIEELT